jgi:hypothetical protein
MRTDMALLSKLGMLLPYFMVRHFVKSIAPHRATLKFWKKEYKVKCIKMDEGEFICIKVD